MAESATPEQKVIVVDFGASTGSSSPDAFVTIAGFTPKSCLATSRPTRCAPVGARRSSCRAGRRACTPRMRRSVDPEIFELGIPVLGFCYGQQIMAVTLGGAVGPT